MDKATHLYRRDGRPEPFFHLDVDTFATQLEKRPNLMIIDVRSEKAYSTGHIRGATSRPKETSNWSTLSKDMRQKEIVVYGSGDIPSEGQEVAALIGQLLIKKYTNTAFSMPRSKANLTTLKANSTRTPTQDAVKTPTKTEMLNYRKQTPNVFVLKEGFRGFADRYEMHVLRGSALPPVQVDPKNMLNGGNEKSQTSRAYTEKSSSTERSSIVIDLTGDESPDVTIHDDQHPHPNAKRRKISDAKSGGNSAGSGIAKQELSSSATASDSERPRISEIVEVEFKEGPIDEYSALYSIILNQMELAFKASLQDLPCELKYNPYELTREVKALQTRAPNGSRGLLSAGGSIIDSQTGRRTSRRLAAKHDQYRGNATGNPIAVNFMSGGSSSSMSAPPISHMVSSTHPGAFMNAHFPGGQAMNRLMPRNPGHAVHGLPVNGFSSQASHLPLQAAQVINDDTLTTVLSLTLGQRFSQEPDDSGWHTARSKSDSSPRRVHESRTPEKMVPDNIVPTNSNMNTNANGPQSVSKQPTKPKRLSAKERALLNQQEMAAQFKLQHAIRQQQWENEQRLAEAIGELPGHGGNERLTKFARLSASGEPLPEKPKTKEDHGDSRIEKSDSGIRFTMFCAFEKSGKVSLQPVGPSAATAGPSLASTMGASSSSTKDLDTVQNEKSSAMTSAAGTKSANSKAATVATAGAATTRPSVGSNELVGTLVLKHTKIVNPAAQMSSKPWAVVKYIGCTKRGVGHLLQKKVEEFVQHFLPGVDCIYSGAWLEYQHSWLSHYKWGYDYIDPQQWPRGQLFNYGKGILSMAKRLK